MKGAVVTTSLIALLAVPAAELRAEVNRDAYGIWVRGKNYDLSEFPYRGVEVDPAWADIEPSEGVFDWRDFDAGLEKATDLGFYTFISINVGPMSPMWLYDIGIPKVMTQHRVRTGPYPYYLDPRHVSYYHRLIEEFGRHVRSLPARLTDRIVFVQVKTGSTGDEAPYKGPPSPAQYAITKEQWDDFRLAAFKEFNAAFQEGPGAVIPLMFNAILDNESLLDWVSKNVKGGWGHKMGGYGQCYQLNDEAERGLDYLPHLLDPAPGEYEFFSRCEMDQGWKGGIFAPNIRMAFYWTGLSALHSGLSMWNLSETAREWCRDNKYWDFAYFFDKYAGQTHSAAAAGAFCALREGLDSADTEKFPEAQFGAADIKNKERYLAICAAYAGRGAKMDDVDGVLAGQVNQRSSQKGLNDAGWMIFRGNYERFLHQIDADTTSVGWWRVGGEVAESTPVYARFARGFDRANGKDAMYFDIKDSFFSGKPLNGAYPMTVRVVYYDKGTGQCSLQYDATDNPKKTAYIVTKTNSGTWKEKIVTLTDANFGNRGPRGADLTLANADAEDDIFHMVEVTRGKRE
ncbi:MAG: beta-galactosidase [Candidatus Sumerlaeota bacterium]|nr:beta-galactosidase [Candidatus Sumerlaeota bacterium]